MKVDHEDREMEGRIFPIYDERRMIDAEKYSRRNLTEFIVHMDTHREIFTESHRQKHRHWHSLSHSEEVLDLVDPGSRELGFGRP